MSELPDLFRQAIPGWSKKECVQALVGIQGQIDTAKSSLRSLKAHLSSQPPSYRRFWKDVLSKRKSDIDELEIIEGHLREAIDR